MRHKAKRKGTWLDRLPSDLFGSDAFVQYQSTYVWQANQVGHFAIGLIASSLSSWIFRALEWSDCAFYILCATCVVAYAAKEFLDLKIAKHQAEDLFELNMRELWEDMAADTWFVGSGVITGAAAHANPYYAVIAFFLSALAFTVLRSVFLPAKRSIDRAALPYMFRLCNFPGTCGVNKTNVTRIEAFIAGKNIGGFDDSQAILIQGYRGTGKTTLAVGIGSEIALRRKKNHGYGRVLYMTAFNLFERGTPERRGKKRSIKRWTPRILGSGDPWTLECTDVLIIDDVDSDNDVYGGSSPSEIMEKLQAQRGLCKLLKSKKTVWVTGSSEFECEKAAHGWSAWLEALSKFYGEEVDKTRNGGKPEDVKTREPIPVIWLRQPLE